MTVKVSPYRGGRKRTLDTSGTKWLVEIRFKWPGIKPTWYRGRHKASGVTSRSAAKRWGEAREHALREGGKEAAEAALIPPASVPAVAAVPTLAEFWPTFVQHCVAERQKASGIDGKRWAFEYYLCPVLGTKRLDEIGTKEIEAVKSNMANKSAKSCNNVLTALSACLKFASPEGLHGAEGLGVISTAPRVRLLRTVKPVMAFYEPEDFQRLVESAGKIDTRTLVLVLLGGHAGLRRGELIGLRWCDVDFARGLLHVRQAAWQGVVDVPKGGRERTVELTQTLRDALKRHQHLRSDLVLCRDDGSPATAKMLRTWVAVAQRRASLPPGPLHILRHTFCSLLAIAGVPANVIQAMAGHANLSTTQKYLHLARSARGDAAQLLDQLGKPAAGAQKAAGG